MIDEGRFEDLERQIIQEETRDDAQIQDVVRPVQEEIVQERRVSQRNANPSAFMHRPSSSGSTPWVRPLSTRTTSAVPRSSDILMQPVPLMNSSMDTIFAKMASATEALVETEDIQTSRQLVNLIKDCADCVQSLKSASSIMQ